MLKQNQYKGPLTVVQAAEGIRRASHNAYALYLDAKLLFEHERYARSLSLSALAVEEAGKASILRTMLMETDPKQFKDLWRRYRSHTAKNAQWIVPGMIVAGARKLEDFSRIFDTQSDHPLELDILKQLGFYTDVFNNVKWSEPCEAIDADLAESFLQVAQVLTAKSPDHDHQAELELWIKYMKPVWNTNMAAMKMALHQIYGEEATKGFC